MRLFTTKRISQQKEFPTAGAACSPAEAAEAAGHSLLALKNLHATQSHGWPACQLPARAAAPSPSPHRPAACPGSASPSSPRLPIPPTRTLSFSPVTHPPTHQSPTKILLYMWPR